MQETQVGPLGQEDPLEKEMATHSSILAWDRGKWQTAVHGGHKRIRCDLAIKQQQQQHIKYTGFGTIHTYTMIFKTTKM